MEDSSLSGNVAFGASGGALYARTRFATLKNVEITGNMASLFGGGIINAGVLTVKNSVVSGNSAGLAGGGIHNGMTLTLKNTSVTGNTPDDCFGC